VAIPYLDDTLIHSPDVSSHFDNLRAVLEAHRRAGLKLQPSKCQIFRTGVDYLGHHVSKEGVRPMDTYVETVKDWPLPGTKSEARIFLGKTGYYRRFVQGYSAIAAPWTDVTGKDKDGTGEKEPLEVTPEMVASFSS
jgi:hypothetical protein